MFSVIIPTYNRLELLKRAVDSVLNQTFQEFEIIIVDDCSSDGTWEWLKSIDNPKINFIKNTNNKGISYNRNIAVKKSKFNYIALLDDDDVWLENHLNIIFKNIKMYPEATLYCNSYIINYGDKKEYAIHDNPFLFKSITKFSGFKCFKNKHMLCAPSASVFEKNKFNELGGFDEDLTYTEDIDLLIRIGLKCQIVHNREVTIEYSQSEGNHASLHLVHKHKSSDFSKYKENERNNKYLKEWLDSIRFQVGLKLAEVNDKKADLYFNNIEKKNLSFYKQIFIQLNLNLAYILLKFKKKLFLR